MEVFSTQIKYNIKTAKLYNYIKKGLLLKYKIKVLIFKHLHKFFSKN